MSEEIQEQNQAGKKPVYIWIFATVFIAPMCEDIFSGIVGLPHPLAVLTADSLVWLLAYRFLPNPKWGFIPYAIVMESWLIGGVLARYVMVPYLLTFLSPVTAHGISLIVYIALFCLLFKFGTRYVKPLKAA
jgi:hypothetical protein